MNITKKELETLTKQEQDKSKIFNEIGLLEGRKHQLLHLLDEVLSEQEKTKIAIEDKYGKGEVNLKDGSFQKLEQ
jgi:hypothetical protein